MGKRHALGLRWDGSTVRTGCLLKCESQRQRGWQRHTYFFSDRSESLCFRVINPFKGRLVSQSYQPLQIAPLPL